MKKLFISITMAVLFISGAAQLHAQDQCVLQNDKGATGVITYSDNMKVAHQCKDQSIKLVPQRTVKPQVRDSADTYSLNIYLPDDYEPGRWFEILVSDGDDIIAWFFDDDKGNITAKLDPFTLDLAEGVYHVIANGYNEFQGYYHECYWTLEGIELTEDRDVFIDFNDCVYDISMQFEDENGNLLNDLEYYDVLYEILFTWKHPQMGLFIMYQFSDALSDEELDIRFNGFNEDSFLTLNIYAEPGDQKSYVVANSLVGMHESAVLFVAAEDMKVTQQMFAVTNDSDTCYYHTNLRTIMDEFGGFFAWIIFTDALVFNPETPFVIVTNAKVENPTDFSTGCKTFLLPTIREGSDLSNWFYDPSIISSFYFNGNGEVVREAKPFFFADFTSPPSYPIMFPETPAMNVRPPETMAYFGERTPLAVYNPLAVNADNTPLNQTILRGGFFFSGENSCDRMCDYDSFIHVFIDGEEIFNDSICNFNYHGSFDLDPAPVVVETNNKHLIIDGVPKQNQTRVEFDLNRDDAMPPTMTFLRVLDGDGDESVCLDNLSQSTLVFGCGDYTYHYTEHEWGGYYDHLEYNAKPEVEVLYCIEGEDWQPLVIAEDESMFHINYGNVFVADLSQLESRALNKWVSLKFMLEDEAGNTQEQTLENVFYSGHTISVDEYAAERVEHEVIPNPFTDEVCIKSAQPLDGMARVQLYDVLGRRVYDATENGHAVNEFIIDGSALKPGIYFYDINTEKGVMRGKIVKE